MVIEIMSGVSLANAAITDDARLEADEGACALRTLAKR